MKLIQSEQDQKQYRVITLDNEITCLLVSDEDTDISAASLSVNVGAFHDPDEFLGLAHCTEHMIFMGSEKFPQPNYLTNFLQKNGCNEGDNAYTEPKHTVYYYDVSNEAFEESLDIFSSYFECPLFLKEMIEKEVNAVNSEFTIKLNNDYFRERRLIQQQFNKGSPVRRFSHGNHESLWKPNLHEELVKFYKKYYSANQMNLVFYTDQSLDEQEALAKKYFSKIKNTQQELVIHKELPFSKNNLQKLIKYVPIKNQQKMSIKWMLPYNLELHYKNKPERLLTHLFGHEGPNSILSVLIDESLALSLTTSCYTYLDIFSIFNISLTLTPKGLQQYKDILHYFFKYLKFLQQSDNIQEWIYKEMQNMSNLEFEFLDQDNPSTFASNLADNMIFYKEENFLNGQYTMENFDKEFIMKLLNSCTEENLLVTLSSKDFSEECTQVEHYFKTQYTIEQLDENILNSLKTPTILPTISEKSLGLPPKNVYIPINNELLEYIEQEELTLPERIYQSDKTDLWHKQDDQFNVCKLRSDLLIQFPEVHLQKETVNDYIYSFLWLYLIKNYWKETKYMISLAESKVKLHYTQTGLKIQIFGFNDSFESILSELAQLLINFKLENQRAYFDIYKQKLMEDIENSKKAQPYNQIFNKQDYLLKNTINVNREDAALKLKTLDFNEFCSFENTWLNTVRLQWQIIGNITNTNAIKLVQQFENTFFKEKSLQVFQKKDVIYSQSPKLKPQTKYFYEMILDEEKEENSAIQVIYQFDKFTLENEIKAKILSKFIDEPFYTQLRTEQQLGYIVWAYNVDISGILYFKFVIQSSVQNAIELGKRIQIFIEKMNESLDQITESEFNDQKESLLIEVTQKYNNLEEEADDFWGEIATNQYFLNKKQLYKNIMSNIKLDDMRILYRDLFLNQYKQITMCCSNKKFHLEQYQKEKVDYIKNGNFIEIVNTKDFKNSHELYPPYRSYHFEDANYKAYQESLNK